MHWCPQESAAVLATAGTAGLAVWYVKFRWNQMKRWMCYRLLAMHLHECNAECGCWRYQKMVPSAA